MQSGEGERGAERVAEEVQAIRAAGFDRPVFAPEGANEMFNTQTAPRVSLRTCGSP